MKSLPVIQSLWVGDRLSTMERLCISSFLQNGHPFHLYVYNNITNAPKGTVLKDASEIISPDKIFKYKDRDTYAGFSNMFRYKLLLEKGNYWVDTDVICLRPFDFKKEYVFFGVWKFYRYHITKLDVQSCVIKAPPGSEIMNYCYEICNSKNLKEIVWGETGPEFLHSAVVKFGLQDHVLNHGAFEPIFWSDWQRSISSSLWVSWREQIKMAVLRSRSVHLYNEMWRLDGVDKNGCFPKNCLYEYLKRRYLVNGF